MNCLVAHYTKLSMRNRRLKLELFCMRMNIFNTFHKRNSGPLNVCVDLVGTTPAIDCEVSRWQPASECSVTIGLGEQTFARYVIVYPQGDGEPCPELNVTVPCSLRQCPRK